MSETDSPASPPGSGQNQPANTPTSAPEPANRELAAELAATKDRLLRCLAEQENIRQQARRDRDQAVRYAAAGFAGDLLATADNLERAIASVSEEKRSDPTIANLLAGVEATRRSLLGAFAKHGLKRLEPIGEPFDPHQHEASFELSDERRPPGVVASVLQPGYIHHDRLLRPALVGVSKGSDATRQKSAESPPSPSRTVEQPQTPSGSVREDG